MDPAVDRLPSLFTKGHHSALGFAVIAIEKTGDPDAASSPPTTTSRYHRASS